MAKNTKAHTLSWHKKKVDKIFSKYIRLRDNGVCFTCMAKDSPKYMQAGHFVPRNISSTRFDERNVNCQCKGCNIFHSGRLDVYAVELEKKYGQGILQELQELKRTHKKFTIPELEEMYEIYKSKLKDLE